MVLKEEKCVFFIILPCKRKKFVEDEESIVSSTVPFSGSVTFREAKLFVWLLFSGIMTVVGLTRIIGGSLISTIEIEREAVVDWLVLFTCWTVIVST